MGPLWRNPSSRFPRPPLRWAQWGAILRALSGYAYISMCRLPPLLLWRVISISKGRNVEARLFIRRLCTCSLTDDLFQPVVEIARRTFPRLALLFLHDAQQRVTHLGEQCASTSMMRASAPYSTNAR